MFKTSFIICVLLGGCAASPTSPSYTLDWASTHSQLSTPVYAPTQAMHVGEQLRLPLIENTHWKSDNQSILMVGNTSKDLVITAIKAGKASFTGYNDYDATKSQTVIVTVE